MAARALDDSSPIGVILLALSSGNQLRKQILACLRSPLSGASGPASGRKGIDARKWLSQKAKHNHQLEWLTDGR
jgi:hypothetical protein